MKHKCYRLLTMSFRHRIGANTALIWNKRRYQLCTARSAHIHQVFCNSASKCILRHCVFLVEQLPLPLVCVIYALAYVWVGEAFVLFMFGGVCMCVFLYINILSLYYTTN